MGYNEENILYFYAYSTNAKSSYGKNVYISAIDLKSFKVIWTTKPLSCNSTFTLADNSIICGYGFSAESDYLFAFDKKTGARKQTLKLDKGPSYIVKDNKIFVEHTTLIMFYKIKFAKRGIVNCRAVGIRAVQPCKAVLT